MNKKSGFTLVELSIVIVIIGLIIAGVSAGQMIVKQAKMRSVITDLDKYKSAVSAFRLQYNALPGDMINATSYWGSGNTTNGNGNGTVEGFPTLEDHYIWNHLSLAGLISGNYPKSNFAGGSIRNFNVPATYGGGVCIDVRPDSQTIGGRIIGGGKGSYLILGTEYPNTTSSNDICKSAGIIPADLAAIDTKIDDGKPRFGLIQGVTGTGAPGSCENGTIYSVSDTNIECILVNDKPW